MAGLAHVIENYVASQPDLLEWGAVPLENAGHRREFIDWLEKGYQADLAYMEKNVKARLEPKSFKPWANSLILFSLKYPSPLRAYSKNSSLKTAAYADGEDYHLRARQHLDNICRQWPGFNKSEGSFYGFADTAPVFEREWAERAGLGWSGKNSCSIHPKWGSAFFIFGFFTSEKIEKSKALPNYCGSCRKCLEACPTNALAEPGVLNSAKCISYHTIENKKEVPAEIAKKFEGWIFGCDICQQVCPWNFKHLDKSASAESAAGNKLDWLSLLERGTGGFKQKYKGTAMQRAGRKAMLRNVLNAISSEEDRHVLPQLKKLEIKEEGTLREKIRELILKLEINS